MTEALWIVGVVAYLFVGLLFAGEMDIAAVVWPVLAVPLAVFWILDKRRPRDGR